MTADIYHGGNLQQAEAMFGTPAQGWLDLSTGINPVPYPIPPLAVDAWTRLPERAAERRLEATAAACFGLKDASRLIATPGTQALIQALPWLVPARRVVILDFTYQEHAHCWQRSGATVETVTSLTDASVTTADVVVVVNPNNPDGRLIDVDTLLSLGREMAARGALLIVDEAFMDVRPKPFSVLPHLPAAGIAVLRSVGKTWGLAGLRLGFLAGPADLVERLRDFFGPWSVSGPALAIGEKALGDVRWLEETCARLERDCAALDAILTHAGLAVAGGTPLFRLVRHDAATGVFQKLGRAGILVRPFPLRPDWLRFGIPATDADRARLAEALR